jgi:hypothetical protein
VSWSRPRFWTACVASSSDQTPPFVMALKTLRHLLHGGQVRVHDGATISLWWISFLFLILFSLLTLDFTPALPKIKCVMSVCICINFDLHSFDCYLFYF